LPQFPQVCQLEASCRLLNIVPDGGGGGGGGGGALGAPTVTYFTVLLMWS
jgi:hypothetical protein